MIEKISIVPYEKESDRKSVWVLAEKLNEIIDYVNANVVPAGESVFLKNKMKESLDAVWGEGKTAILVEIDKLIRNWQYAQRSDYSSGYVDGLHMSRGIVANHL